MNKYLQSLYWQENSHSLDTVSVCAVSKKEGHTTMYEVDGKGLKVSDVSSRETVRKACDDTVFVSKEDNAAQYGSS